MLFRFLQGYTLSMDTIAINYWAVLLGGIFLVVMGTLWYGPIFGKVWMKIVGAPDMSKEEMKKTQKEMMPYYLVQFLFSLVTSFVLYYFVKLIGFHVAFWIWLGFAMSQAAGAMWDTEKKYAVKKFLVIAGYYLVVLLALGWAYTMW